MSKISMAQIKTFKTLKETFTSDEVNLNFDSLALKYKGLFENKNLCTVCYDFEFNDANTSDVSKTVILECGHKYCKLCMVKYIKAKIQRFYMSALKCINPDCRYKISEREIESILEDGNLKRYKLIKNKNNFYYHLNPNFVPCPYPDCESLVELDNSLEELKKNKNLINDKSLKIFYTCSYRHEFCILCREPVHRNKKCIDVITNIIYFFKNFQYNYSSTKHNVYY